MKRFENKTIWITGASSGIGKALAYKFADEGAELIISARNIDKLNSIKNDLQNKTQVFVAAFDISSKNEIEKSAEIVFDKFNKIDILINNSGVSQRSKFTDTDIPSFRKILEVNFFGTVQLTKLVLPEMIKNGGGHIVAVSSIVGKFGFPLRSAYSAAKHALHGFFETVRAENEQDNIKITMLIPGQINTDISINAISENGKAHGKMDRGQDNGMDVNICAEKMIKGISKQKKEVLIGRKEILMVHIRRFLPRIYYRLVSKLSAT